MKTNCFRLFAGGFLLVIPGYLGAQAGYTNVIEMVELSTDDNPPLIWRMPGTVPSQGYDHLIGEPVPEGGAVFILSTIQSQPSFMDWYLDQVAVGTYLPRAEVTVRTHDTESTTLRVRADRPIELEVTVSGLFEEGSLEIDPSAVQLAAREVRLQRFSEAYPEHSNSLPGNEVSSPAHTELSLVGNGTFPLDAGDLTFYSTLSPDRPEKARGEEHFVVRSLADAGFAGAALEEVAVQVWPVWGCKMEGMEDPTFLPYEFTGSLGQQVARPEEPVYPEEDYAGAPDKVTYQGAPPEITFSWYDLYPSTTVGIIINDAAKPYPWGGSWVGGTSKVFNEDSCHDYSITVTDWGEIFSGPGRYAIWMVTYTPGIGWEVGGQYDSNGNLTQGGWVVPIARSAIGVRASIMSLNE
ncbi:hypothetical protein [Roseibacillus persicicus]|uniref:hypothetical protein n=1 Tax=Roseibacillus persicicus TaxID=454148 RepID=UPI0028102E5C|nr:hypothetical protein [Roseibacillus persicicus]MDQ8191910.1 hypothetical protein [Roseibacillus persicicus]